MDSDGDIHSGRKLADRFLLVALVALTGATGLAVYAVCAPLGSHRTAFRTAVRPLATTQRARADDVQALVAKVAGNPLIKPAQVSPAVKDTGAAKRLLKKLRLHGITQVGEQRTAYVQIEGKRVVRLRQGDEILGFVVDRVGPAEVVLRLDGVLVMLRN